MKSIFVSALICVFSFFFFVVTPSVYAQTDVLGLEVTPTVPVPTPTPVEYQLPYPGILPDNPFYPFKILRDRIVGFLISNPVKKAEFDLLQADKRLAVGLAILDKKGEAKTAYSTIEKAENYMGQAIDNVEVARKQGMGTREIVQKIDQSAKKHREVLLQLGLTDKSGFIEGYAQLAKRVYDYQKRITKLLPK